MNFDHRNGTSSKHTAICPLCHATELEIKYVGINDRLGYVKGEFDFFQCAHCKSVSLFPFPKEEEVGSFYPESFMVSEPTPDRSLPGSLRSIEWKILFTSMQLIY